MELAITTLKRALLDGNPNTPVHLQLAEQGLENLRNKVQG